MRILVIEDEVKLAQIIAEILRRENYRVDLAFDGEAGLDLALTGSYDVIVLDRMLPGLDGLQVCRYLRTEGVETPVLMLTARRELPERVEGLDAGADDYLGKPFAFAELLARIRALSWRSDRPLVPAVLRVRDVTLDQRTHRVERAGQEIDLSPGEYMLLEYLMRHPSQALTRDQILERIWGYDAEPEGNVVDLYVHYLRKKLDRGRTGSLIQTIRGVGYAIRE
jgi:DNA-binding response OmpR family regulator